MSAMTRKIIGMPQELWDKLDKVRRKLGVFESEAQAVRAAVKAFCDANLEPEPLPVRKKRRG